MANCYCVGKLPGCTCKARCRCDGCTCWNKDKGFEMPEDIELKIKSIKENLRKLPPNCS